MLGAAFDCNIQGFSPDDGYAQAFMEAGLTTLEDGAIATTWIHSDIRPTGLSEILIVGG